MRVKTPVFLQLEATECGAVALRIILAYYGCFIPASDLRTACGVSRDGVRADHLIEAAKTYGLKAQAFRKNIAKLQELPLPFISFLSFNHFVVVEGFEKDTVYVNDPAHGRRVLSADEFSRQFTGIVLTFEPTEAFVKSAARETVWHHAWARVSGSASTVLFILGMSAALVIPAVAVPAIMRSFIDDILLRGLPIYLPLLLIMALTISLAIGISALQQHQSLQLENTYRVSLASKFMWRLLHLSDHFFTTRSVGELISRFELTQSLANFLTGDLFTLLSTLILVVAYLVILAVFNPVLPLMSGFLLALYFAASFVSARLQTETAYRYQDRVSKLIGTAVHSLRSIDHVKGSGAEADVFNRLASHYTAMLRAQQEIGFSNRNLTVFVSAITFFNTLIVLIWGVAQVAEGRLTVGEFAAAQALSFSLWQAVVALTGFPTRVRQMDAALNRLNDVYDTPVQAIPTSTPIDAGLELKDIVFGYKRREAPLFNGLNLKIEAGTSLAIVGASGSGKTTLARLIGGLYAPWSGEISRPSTMLVDQEIFLFDGTLYDNLTFWDSSISRETLDQAVRDAELDDDLARLPHGFQTFIETDGRNLSGGQKQRTQLARALAKQPQLLILDEATNALDPILERCITQNLRRRGCACIVVTHRLDTAQNCDQIIVLENGRIVEWGTPQELKAQDGVYARMSRSETAQPLNIAPPEAKTPTVSAAPTQRLISRGLPEALANLQSLLIEDHASILDDVSQTTEPLFAACQIVAREQGFALQMNQEGGDIFAIAAASQIYARKVLLDRDWWMQDNGVFVAFQDHAPVTLLRRYDRYVMVDPQARTLIPVDEACARTLKREVYQFHYSLLTPKITRWQFLRFIFAGTKREWQTLLISGIALGVLQIIPTVFISLIFDTLLPTSSLHLLAQIVLALVGVLCAVLLFTTAQENAAIRLYAKTEANFQSALWMRLLHLPAGFFRGFSVGDLTSRLLMMSQELQTFLLSLPSMLFASLFLMVSLLFIASFNGSLGLLTLGWMLLYIVFAGWFGVRFSQLDHAMSERQGQHQGWLTALIPGVNHLRIANALERAFIAWTEQFKPMHRAVQSTETLQTNFAIFNTAYALLTLIFLLLIGYNSGLSVGQFIAFYSLFLLSTGSLQSLGRGFFTLLHMLTLYRRIEPILHAFPETGTDALSSPRLHGQIRVENVSFRYHPARPLVLQDLSLDIKPGEFVAIVGASGSGKSTLLRLLLGLEQPTSGRISYDHFSLDQLHLPQVRRQIGTVLQQSSLIHSGSVFANVSGMHQLTGEQVWEALQLTGLAEDIRQMPMGLHTILTDGGQTLSMGQRQRLLLARALAGKPRILLLDEATSSLDAESQAQFIHNLGTLGLTRIMIAHRLSTVRYADRILVLQEGSMIQQGTYAQLSQQKGLFADILTIV